LRILRTPGRNGQADSVAQTHQRTAAMVLCVAALLMALASAVSANSITTQNSPPSPSSDFTDRDASALLNQITDGFTARNAKKVLATFDLAAMPDGDLFRQQIIAFFAQTDTVRIHFNLVKTSTEAGKGTAEVEVEMEAAPRDDNATPVHKRESLRFAATHNSRGWKFTDVQPRSFFSLQP
jgi:hypothetical protein